MGKREMAKPTIEQQMTWKNKVKSLSSKEKLKLLSRGMQDWKFQILSASLTDEDLVDFFTLRYDFIGRIDIWIHSHSHIFWSLIHWNWFCIYCGKHHFRQDKCRKEVKLDEAN